MLFLPYNKMIALLLVAGMAFAVSCHTSKKASEAKATTKAKAATATETALTEADVKRGAEKYPGYTLAKLTNDKAMYERKCGACHPAKAPSSEPKEKWPGIINAMVEKAAGTADKKISKEEQAALTRYLYTMSSK